MAGGRWDEMVERRSCGLGMWEGKDGVGESSYRMEKLTIACISDLVFDVVAASQAYEM